MKKFLILIIILSYLGAIASIYKFALKDISNLYSGIVFISIISIINAICSKYLYSKASTHKIEWGLFGFLWNINALFIFWLYSTIWTKRENIS